MSLKLELPSSFYDELGNTLKAIYKEAIDQARRDMSITKEYLTIPEVLRYFNLSRNTLNEWINKGVPVYRIEGKTYLNKTEVEAFIKQHRI